MKNIILKLILIVTVLMIVPGTNAVYANFGANGQGLVNPTILDDAEDGGSNESQDNSSNQEASSNNEGLPNLDDTAYKPSVSLTEGESTFNIITQILGILTVLGVVAVVIAIALIGFNSILGSASEKADYQQKLVGVVIAGIFMVAGSTIAKFIISIAENV